MKEWGWGRSKTTSRINQAEDRLSVLKGKIEGLDQIRKEHNNFLSTVNVGYLGKIPWIIGIDEEKESQINGIDQTFCKITEENLSKLRKDTPE